MRRSGVTRAALLALGLILGPGLGLGGCATPPSPAVPATRTLAVAPASVLEASLSMLMERGYVIRHADAELGRLEAVIARWPGYRVQLDIEAADGVNGEANVGRSRLAMTAWRGGRPLPPSLVEPLLTELSVRLDR
ncbi:MULTISPECIES: hypothetical protein [Halomonas]|uniref:Lipoprotein n=1 Tax=Halomonas halophila TaxID=29573 RepID=A0ABQ0U3Z1_9GAMM|nr:MULTISPECIES: hypothetical protein [Halomonas]MDR5890684.1 hypothetical protein [Halomonas salina]RAH37598.1 hypothetical protein C9J49_010070 [Halomonas sp. SL1]WJY07607.1 hypothetical protein QWG60_01575 [Halomonas halophila]GEK73239.1 hypothetical protein HHA04nite_17830 [Halomonas halophila]